MAGRDLHQIPAIAVEILEDCDGAVIVRGGFADEVDAGGGESGVIASEIIGGEEQEDAAASLVADGCGLFGRGGAGEEDRGGVFRRVLRADGDPAFVLGGLVGVFDQREAEGAGVEGEGFVIVSDDESYGLDGSS